MKDAAAAGAEQYDQKNLERGSCDRPLRYAPHKDPVHTTPNLRELSLQS